jgi:hypothetical protein
MIRTVILAAAVAALGLAACGEKTQVTVYKQGHYQGKPDSRPWEAAYKGDQAAWEKAIKARNNGQNEYVRIAAQ